MRDPERLDAFYDELKRIHKTYFPDWRFGQLVENENIFIEKLQNIIDNIIIYYCLRI